MRIVLIGTGFGERVVAPVWRKLGCDVLVLSPRDRAGIERACANPVDLVSVHSPPFLHYDHVMLALAHNHNILCDKPFGRNAREARAMRDRAVAAGVLHFLNFEFRRHPARMHAKALIDGGAIGKLTHISWSFIGSGLTAQRHRWLFDRSQAGGWIGAWGSHAVDGLRYFFGDEIAACGALTRTETSERPDADGALHLSTAEDAFSAWFKMCGGGSASIDTAYSTSVTLPQRLILLGSEGGIEIVDEKTSTLRRLSGVIEEFSFDPPPGDPHEPGLFPWLSAVRDAVIGGCQITPSFEDGLGAAIAMDQMRETI